MIDLRKGLLALLLCMGLASSALAQGWPPVPLGPSGGGGGGGGGGVTIGAAITGTCPNGDVLFSSSGTIGCEVVSGTGTVTSVGWTGGIVSIANPTTVPAFTIAGTSGGIPYFASTSTWASSGLLAANALMIGGGAGTAPSTTTTGTGVLTALGVNIGSAGAFAVNGGALGTPSSGNGANLTGLVYAALPALSANQVLGALTATTPSGQSVPSCSGATNALIWTSGTGFGCNTITGGGGVNSVSNSDSTLTISPTTGAVVASLNTSNANNWPGQQTFVAPVLGAATATSLAIGGATLGSNAFAVTGLANFASVGSASAPTLSVGNQTTGFYSVSTTGFGLAVNGVNKLDWGITTSGVLTSTTSIIDNNGFGIANANGSYQIGASVGTQDVFLSRHAAANWQLGTIDSAAPVAQTLGVQSVVAGTSNTAGANWTLNGSVSTGSGTSGDIVFKTGGTGAAATVQNSEVAALTLKGATQTVQLNATAYPSCGSLATNSSGVIGCGSGPVPLTVGGSASLTGSLGYYVCTTTCSITLPTPAAGTQFCVRNDSAVTTVITIVAISLVQFEKTTYNGYGTVTTGTMVSTAAEIGDKICLIGRDATHYLVGSFVGTWTNS